MTLPSWFKVVSKALTPQPLEVQREKNILLDTKGYFFFQFGGGSHYCEFVFTQNNPIQKKCIHDNTIHHWRHLTVTPHILHVLDDVNVSR